MGKSDVEKMKVAAKSKREKGFLPSKVVIRRLPPSLTEEKLKECLGVLPEYDFFYFVDGKLSFEPMMFSRAYINFTNPDDIIKFRDEFDGFVFTDDRGQCYPAVVEYAPFQGLPKKKNRKDPKCNTIEQDKDYLTFLESLKKDVEPMPSIETYLEEIEARKDKNIDKKTTPLLEYLKMKRSNRAASRLGPGKKRQEKDEAPKTLKKNTSSKDSKVPPPREDKSKTSMKKVDNRDTGRRDQNRREDDKRLSRDKKDSPSEKDSKSPRNQKERDGKNRPESGRQSNRADDRRHGNRRDRPESERRDTGTPKGRDDRGRRFNDSYSDDRRRDNPPNENRSSGSKNNQNVAKGRDRDKEESAKKHFKEKDNITERETMEKNESDKEAARKRDAEREKDANRVKNKDRPDRAIYQPRTSRGSRAENTDYYGKAEAKANPERTQDEDKEHVKEKGENKERDFRDKNRERNRDRERDRRGDRRDRDRDKPHDKDREKERDRERERHRERERERDRARRNRERRDRERDSVKEQRTETNQGSPDSKTSTSDTVKNT